MIFNTTSILIRRNEIDKMGYVYHGNFTQFFEIGRTELLRGYGFSYKDFEKSGIIMPVVEMNIKYLYPVIYDDIIEIKTILEKIPSVRVEFKYEITNQNKKLVCVATTTLVFLDKVKNRPTKPPLDMMLAIKKYFE